MATFITSEWQGTKLSYWYTFKTVVFLCVCVVNNWKKRKKDTDTKDRDGSECIHQDYVGDVKEVTGGVSMI